MPDIMPNVYVKENSTIIKAQEEDFSTLFICFGDYGFEKSLITLENSVQVFQYSFLQKSQLKRSIDIFFANKGRKLYLLNYPLQGSLNIYDFEEFLTRECDKLNDVEVITAVDIYSSDLKLEKEILPLYYTINNYCSKTHKLSITDINQDITEEHLDRLGETTIYYPWILDKDMKSIAPSVYVSSLLSNYASQEKAFSSIANKEILNAVDITESLKKDEIESYTNLGINPVIFVPHNGVRIWGVKTFNSNIDTTVEMRILKYIKRRLLRLAKVYIFELNNSSLEDKLLSNVDSFLYKLWERGALVGGSKDEAYRIGIEPSSGENSENSLILHIAVALTKPLEFIYIELSKVERDGSQSTLSVN